MKIIADLICVIGHCTSDHRPISLSSIPSYLGRQSKGVKYGRQCLEKVGLTHLSSSIATRVGVFLTTPTHRTPEFEELKKLAINAESVGYDSVWVSDHFYSFPTPGEDVFDSLATLAALAPVTSRIRLGVMALCNSYRQPSLLAKMASTIDVISNGRLELGIGSGWYQLEYRAYGYPFPSARVRAEQLSESAQILKLMWTQNEATFQGKYFSLQRALDRPKPIQEPHPPLWIAGGGEKLTFRVVAEFADCGNFYGLSPEECKMKNSVLDGMCEQLGKDPDRLVRSWGGNVIVGENHSALKQQLRAFHVSYGTLGEGIGKMIAGTTTECADQIRDYLDAGITYFIGYVFNPAGARSWELFHDAIKSV